MAKSNLYTRTGDSGTTSLVGGERINKNSTRLDAYGTIDEFSSFLGVVLSDPDCPEDIRTYLLRVQNRLFDVGCYLATLPAPDTRPVLSGMDEAVAEAESWTDDLDERTPKIRAFVLPGGCPLSAHTHVARTVCRRAERRILSLAEESYVDPDLIRYINRLSDFLFILARYFNHLAGVEELTWQPLNSHKK